VLKTLFDLGFQGVEALADELFSLYRRGLEPRIADGLEPPLFTAQPLEAKGFDGLGRGQCGR
jgi:hypothetical protein